MLLLWGVDHDFTKTLKAPFFFVFFFKKKFFALLSSIISSILSPHHVGGMGLQDLMDLSQCHMQILLMNLFFVSSLYVDVL